MPIEATNGYVWTKRDETETEKGGLLLPGAGKVKPNTAKILSSGETVKDSKVKRGKGRKAIFPKGAGQEIEYKGETYLILAAEVIFGIDDYDKANK